MSHYHGAPRRRKHGLNGAGKRGEGLDRKACKAVWNRTRYDSVRTALLSSAAVIKPLKDGSTAVIIPLKDGGSPLVEIVTPRVTYTSRPAKEAQRIEALNGDSDANAPSLHELLYEMIDRKGEDAALDALVSVAALHHRVAALHPIAAG
jgi:hypothetical protein